MSLLNRRLKIFIISIITIVVAILSGMLCLLSSEHENDTIVSSTFSNNLQDNDIEMYSMFSTLNAGLPTGVTDWSEVLNLTLNTNGDSTQYYTVTGLKDTYSTIAELEIPAVATDGIAITTIAESAFREKTQLTTITISENVTSIGNYAFYNCTYLTEINFNATNCADLPYSNYVFYRAGYNTSGINVKIGANVTKIPAYLFCPYIDNYQTPKIVTVNFAENSACTSIGGCAFEDCTYLREINLPENLITINNFAFYYCNNLTEIKLPETLASIGDSAFYQCYKLTEIILPEKLTSIQSSAFSRCSGLTSIAIPESITSYGSNIFSYCTSLQTVELPSNLTTIPYGLLYNCSSLETITIPESVISIGDHAFRSCSDLTSIEIPENVTSIGSYAFENCSSLETINLPTNLTSISNDLFRSCNSLKSITIPEGVTSIGRYAFGYCLSLTSIEIPENVTSIGSYTFEYCRGLETVNLSTNLTSISTGAFYSCSSLKSITIPEKVTNLGSNAFASCSALTEINFNATNCTSSNSGVFQDSGKDGSGIVLNIGANVTKIPDFLFDPSSSSSNYSYHTNLISVKFAENSVCTSIGRYAFSDCIALNGISLPEGITSIGYAAFYNCTGLESVTIPESVASIGSSAFSHCSSLKSIDIPSNVTIVSNSLFLNCTMLETVNLPDGITIIEGFAFNNCTSLKTIDLPQELTTIQYYAFENCNLLENLVIPSGVTSIGHYAFTNCSNLKTINLPNGITIIEEYTFNNCSSLEMVVFSESITVIEEYAFYNCSSLEEINLPKGLTTIMEYAFYNCGVKVLTIPASIVNIGNNAFYCLDLEKINFDAGQCSTDMMTKPFYNAGKNTYDLGNKVVLNVGPNVMSLPAYMFMETYITEINFAESSQCDTIGDYCFTRSKVNNCIGLSSIKTIGNYAFMGCEFDSIDLNEGLLSIGVGAFAKCENLSSITLPSTLQVLDEMALYRETPGLKVSIPGSITNGERADVIKLLSADCMNQAIVMVPYEDLSKYKASDYYTNSKTVAKLITLNYYLTINYNTPGKVNGNIYVDTSSEPIVFEDVITDNIRSGYVFDGWYVEESLTAESLVLTTETIYKDSTIYARWVYMGDWSQMYTYESGDDGNVYITGLNVDKSLGVASYVISKVNTSAQNVYGIAENAFGAEKIQSISFESGNSITIIKKNAFIGNVNLASIDFANATSLMTIEDMAFKNCGIELTLILPENIVSIGKEAFLGNKITAFRVSNDSFSSENGIIYSPDKSKVILAPNILVSDIVLNAQATTISSRAFAGTSGILNISGAGVTNIESNAFVNSTIEYFEFPSLVMVGANAFDGANLKTIKLAKTLTTIEDSAFINNSLLTDIVLEGKLGVNRDSIPTFADILASNEDKIIIYVEKNDIDAYKATDWSRFTIIGLDAGDVWLVTVDLDGGSGYSEVYHIINGSKMDLSIMPTKTGYEFVSWKKVVSGELIDFSIDTPITEDTDIKAVWKMIIYEIKYILNGGNILGETDGVIQNFIISDFGEDLDEEIAISVPEQEGYTFVGWYINEDFDSAKVRSIKFDELTYNQVLGIEDVMLYAKWEILTYTMIFDESSLYAIKLDSTTLNPAPWHTDFGFILVLSEAYSNNTVDNVIVKLYSADGATYVSTLTAIPNEATDLHYVIENVDTSYIIKLEGLRLNEYSVYFVSELQDTNNMPNMLTIQHGDNINMELSTPSKDGYVFKTWHLRITDGESEKIDANAYDFTSPIYEDITLVAKFEAIEYTITLYLNGATLNNNKVESFVVKYTIENAVVLPLANNVQYNIERPGYTLVGWYTDYEKDATGNYIINTDSIVTTIEKGSTGDKSLVLGFDINEYHITYYFNGGSYDGEYQTTFTVEDTFEFIVPDKAGYSFEGWYKDSTTTNIKVDKLDKGISANLTLYARWNAETYTITYHLNGSSYTEVYIQGMMIGYETNTYVENYIFDNENDYVLNASISRNGYTFDGWYEEADFAGNKVLSMPAGSIIADKNFYAKWNPIVYTITFDYTDLYIPIDTDILSISVSTLDIENADGSYAITAVPSIEGYTFEGWYKDGVKLSHLTLSNIGNMTLVANYVVEQCEIILVGDNVENNVALYKDNILITSVDYGSDLVFQVQIINHNYSNSQDKLSVSWSYDENGEYEALLGISGVYTIEDVVDKIYIKVDNLELNKFTIQFITNGGTEIEAITGIEYGSYIVAPGEPQKEGYTFGGWYTTSELEEKFNFNSEITSNLNLYAKWNTKEYIATLTNNINSSTKNIEFNVETQATISLTSNNFIIPGYEVVAFYLIPADYVGDYVFDDNDIIENLLGLYTDVSIVAKFEMATYNIYYGIDNGENNAENPVTYTVVTDTIVLKPATKLNFNFVSWVNVETGSVVTLIPKGSTGDIYLVANFRLESEEFVSVRYYANGEFYSEAAVQIGTSIKDTPSAQVPIKNIPGYEFKGYYEDSAYQIPFDMDTDIDVNINIYGKYEMLNYTITYQSNVGKFTNHESNKTIVNIEDDFNLEDASKTGYIFDGWFKGVELSYGKYDFSNAIRVTRIINQDANLTLYAKFSVIDYTITYELNGGELTDRVDNYNIDSDTIILATPIKTGYKFIKWIDAVTTETITRIKKGSIGNLKIEAIFEIITYKVTYIDNKSSFDGNPEEYNVHSSAMILGHNDVLGYDFVGWYDESGNKIDVVGGGNVGNYTLTARYRIIEYLITYVLDGGSVQQENPSTYTIETSVDYLNPPSKLGYSFLYWKNAQTGDKVEKIVAGSTGELVLMAVYKAVENFNVVIYYIEGNKYLLDSVETGATINNVVPPVKQYYSFDGWYADTSFTNKITSSTIVSADMSVYAHFVPINYNITYTYIDGNGTRLNNINNPNDSTFNIEKLVQFVAPSKPGYSFVKFVHNGMDIETTFGLYENINVTAVFNITQFTISYVLNDGIANNPATYTINSSPIVLNDAEKDGFTFLGWYDVDTDEKVTSINPSALKNYTLIAKWQDNSTIVKADNGRSRTVLAIVAVVAVLGVLGSFVVVKIRKTKLTKPNKMKRVKKSEKMQAPQTKPSMVEQNNMSKPSVGSMKKANVVQEHKKGIKQEDVEVEEDTSLENTEPAPTQDRMRDVFVIPNEMYNGKPKDDNKDQ